MPEPVDIFRRTEFVPDIVDAAIAISRTAYELPGTDPGLVVRRGGLQAARPLTVWMQLGIVHNEAAERARAAGLTVAMDRCLKIDHMSRTWRSR